MGIDRQRSLFFNRMLLILKKYQLSRPSMLLFFFCTGLSSFAQDQETFDKLYDKTYKQTAQQDLNRALAVADSLYQSSRTTVFRVRSLILIARLYQQKEDQEKAIEYALKAEKLAAEAGDYAWQARANGYLAGLYRMMEVYEKARTYLEKALEIVPKIKDPEKANNTGGLMQQELAFCAMDVENYRDALSHLHEAQKKFNQVKENKDFLLMANERLLGQNYYYLKNYDSALLHFRTALQLSTGQPIHYITGMIYKGLAETLLGKGDLPEAKSALEMAEKIADESQYLQLKQDVYAISKDYYTLTKDAEKLAALREKKDSVADLLLDKRAALLNNTYKELEQRGIRAEAMSNRKTIWITVVLVCFVLSLVFLVLYRKKKQKELQYFREIIKNLQSSKPLESNNRDDLAAATQAMQKGQESTVLLAPDESPSTNKSDKSIMIEETELKLRTALDDFEKSELFCDKGLSLPALATSMETNTKYLSHVIRTYKKADFNSYINELRVNYIIERLRNNPEWRRYKISVLADAAGFSSHSQFTTTFKAIKNISPSAFIRYLDATIEP